MLKAVRAVAWFLQEKIGWNRIGFLLSATIITVAVVVLYRQLRGIDLNELYEALRHVRKSHVAVAALAVAAGYFTLTFYDWFALRTIGRKEIPYRIAALAGFTSYSVGHNVGATVFTGGAVRYRIYSAWGLDAIEVAKICFIAGLTFWLGNAAVLGLGITYEPEAASAIDQFPPWVNRILLILVMALVLMFQTSSNLASAYGVSVTGSMLIDTILLIILASHRWRVSPWILWPVAIVFLTVDIALLSSNAEKFLEGAWFPVALGICAFTVMRTWRHGRDLVREHVNRDSLRI